MPKAGTPAGSRSARPAGRLSSGGSGWARRGTTPPGSLSGVEIRELAVPDSWVLDLTAHGDTRGRFTEWYRADVLSSAAGFGLTLAQANHSVSARGVLRGVHFA